MSILSLCQEFLDLVLTKKLGTVRFMSPDEIVEDLIIRELSASDQEEIKKMNEDDLILHHHSFGRFIRNKYELWNEKNPYTLKDYEPCFKDDGGITIDINPKHPDNVSHQIIHDLWERLRGVDKTPIAKKESELSRHKKMLRNL